MKFKPAAAVVQILFGANIVTAVLMLLTGYSYLIDPQKLSVVAVWGMFYPVFLAADLLFLFLWLFIKPFKAWLAFLALVLCYVPNRIYMGLNLPREEPGIGLKVMSYNVLGFRGMTDGQLDWEDNELVHFLAGSGADILCLQETHYGKLPDKMQQELDRQYPYSKTMTRRLAANHIAIYSKWPIVKADTIEYDSRANLSAAFTLATPTGSILVINNHLETNHLTVEDKENFRNMVSGNAERTSVGKETSGLFRKLSEAVLMRNPQAKAVAEYVKMHKDLPIILCGDFNEPPLSYTHHIMGRGLTDCFSASGTGFGWTYCHNGMRVRIDNIMCSDHFESKKCEVLGNVDYSDHYPVVAWLQFKGKTLKDGANP